MKIPPPTKNPFWYNSRIRSILFQIIGIVCIIGVVGFLYKNTQDNLAKRSIATGFDFLNQESGFDIGESMIEYSAADTYSRALLVGAINTLKVSVIGIILSIIIGTVAGIARLSSNWLVSKLAGIYVEGLRNVPLLLQLFFWYALFTESLPHPRKALEPFTGVFLCNRGLYFAIPENHPAYLWMGIALGAAIVLAKLIHWYGRRYRESTGKSLPVLILSMILIVGAPLTVWLTMGAPRSLDIPVLGGFNFRGGLSISPEFGALLLGLILYTGAFIAEVVRSGIQSVGAGQSEAAAALGLGRSQILNQVVLPQALRVIIPPLTNQMLNLIKNSSLAVGIGYPDFVSVANTSLNQTGQAIEGVALIMALYLIFSLITSMIMNAYNKRVTWGGGRESGGGGRA